MTKLARSEEVRFFVVCVLQTRQFTQSLVGLAYKFECRRVATKCGSSLAQIAGLG